MFDLLSEPLFSLKVDGEAQTASLPQILAHLSNEREVVFTAVRRHQMQAWHAFLVQLGALALARGGLQSLSKNPEEWVDSLLRLTDEDRGAWHLVVDDVTKPAFFQAPVLDFDEKKTKPFESPDEIDLLCRAKNFDLKIPGFQKPATEHWIFSLVARQTCDGAMGRCNYPIVRMNGASASRPLVTFAPSLSWSSRFVRDIGVWMEERVNLGAALPYDPTWGHPLVWMVPWSQKVNRLELSDLDPFFIEISKLMRFQMGPKGLGGWYLPVEGSRIVDNHGFTGDIWTPTINEKDYTKSLSVPSDGFTYKRLIELLFGDWEWPGKKPRPGDTLLIAQVLCRGQGKTEGYHERVLPFPHMEHPTQQGALAQERVERANEAGKILSSVLRKLFENKKIRSFWLREFDDLVDACFFPKLLEAWELLASSATEEPQVQEAKAKEVRLSWDQALDSILQEVFEKALRSGTLPQTRRFGMIAKAESTLHWARRNRFSELYEKLHPPKQEDTQP